MLRFFGLVGDVRHRFSSGQDLLEMTCKEGNAIHRHTLESSRPRSVKKA